ncbi:MAG: T9SS type A sorting domain-containing protein [Chitinophagaceae bacterium]|nr:MAG: T9SS type A sorting domain-containing protein [Chitinophagaceae bacterium]
MNYTKTLQGLFALLLLTCFLPAGAQDTIRVQVHPAQARKPVSPYIYGVNDRYARATTLRLGGNRLTSYNWENNASNAGHDYIHHSDEYVPWQQGVPDSLMEHAGSAIQAFHDRALAQNAYSLVTLPMAGYVAADKRGTIQAADAAPSARWKEVRLRKGAPLSLIPDTTDGAIYLEEELNFLLHHYGQSNTATGIRGYSLDNEPCLWFSTHPRLFGETHVAVDTLLRRSIALANLIKDMDPTAEVFGPALYGFNAYLDLQQAPDWGDYNSRYDMFVHYYLDEMRRQDSAGGRRLLDVLDLHWYPEYNFTSRSSPFGNGTDPATNKARMDAPRSLWDSSYVENTWIGNGHAFRILPVLPKLRSMIDTWYPGTKLALTEYSYMGGGHPSGGIAQADALGAFGREGLYMAHYWGAPTGYIQSGFDLFRNYNGLGGSFPDTSVRAVTSNIEISSVYAGTSGSDSSLRIIALNKDQDAPRTFTFTINSDVAFHGARVWGFDRNGSALRQFADVRQVNNNTFTYTLPPMSGLHFVLTTEDLFAYPFIETSSAHPPAGYSDGVSVVKIGARITDGDNNLQSVTLDLSPLGGPAAAPLQQAADSFWISYTLPVGIASGMKELRLTAVDADGHSAQATLQYRVIAKVPPKKIWDGDLLAGGDGTIFHDGNDSHAGTHFVERRPTGGNEEPGSLYMHFGHDHWMWNLLCFRFAPNAAQPVDISEFQYLEFYIRGNPPAGADIELSLQDCSAGQNNSQSVRLKAGGYVDHLSGTSYSRVRIPLSDFTDGVPFDLTRTWQLNFLTNTADTPFDIWVDDIRAVPYPDPLRMPVIRDLSVTPGATYADGHTALTLQATVTDPDGDLAAVTLDLAPLNGSNKTVMTTADSIYTVSYNIPALPDGGTINLQVSARDAANNEVTATVPFTLHRFATTDTIWNGDSKPFGAVWVNSDSTRCALRDTGGYKRPGSMQALLKPDPPNVNWAAIVWDWNENTFNHNLQDATDKRYISFWMRVADPVPGLELEFSLKDFSATPSSVVRLVGDGYVSSFTGGWQRVEVPLSVLVGGSDINRAELARFVLICNSPPVAGVHIAIDDITFGGSLVADVRIARSDAACGDNGSLDVTSLPAGAGAPQYFLNGNAHGASSATGLAPGTYLVKVTGDDGFIYCEQVDIGGSRAFGADAAANGRNINVVTNGGWGPYGYLWSNGATTPALTNADPGNYTVTVTDSASGCQASASALVANTLPLRLLRFDARLMGNDAQLTWAVAEEDVAGYDVLHSTDGRRFEPLGQVPAGATQGYVYWHRALTAGSHYYQLRWREPDGRILHSPVRRLFAGAREGTLTLTPNPARDYLQVSTPAAITQMELTGADGRTWPCSATGTGASRRLDLQGLPPGVYLLRVFAGGEIFSGRFTHL